MNAKTETAAPAIAPAPESAVDTLIRRAGTEFTTMFATIKEAASLAAAELPKGKTTVDAHAMVMAAHKGSLSAVSPNVKQLFSDALWLHAASSNVVEIKVAGSKEPHQVKATEALDASQHNMKAAAQQVREQLGAGRAKGGGRPATAPTAVACDAKGEPITVKTEVQYDVLFADAGEVAKAIAALERIGYTVAKKGRVVKSAPATNAPTPGIAAMVKGKEAILAAAA